MTSRPLTSALWVIYIMCYYVTLIDIHWMYMHTFVIISYFQDILKCLCLIGMVGIAFMIGLQNVFWYYNVRENIEVLKRDFTVPAEDAFGE